MTGRFQRRALTVEAWQYDDAGPAIPRWLERISKRHRGSIVFPNQSIPAAELGDWVVLYPDGHIAIMAAGVFEAEFEGCPADTSSLAAALARVPEGFALDHLCEHWRVDGNGIQKSGGATCKLVVGVRGSPCKLQAEGETLAAAVSNAVIQARAYLAGKDGVDG